MKLLFKSFKNLTRMIMFKDGYRLLFQLLNYYIKDIMQIYMWFSDVFFYSSKKCKNQCEGRTRSWDIASLLIKPVQRVLKYPLLLQVFKFILNLFMLILRNYFLFL